MIALKHVFVNESINHFRRGGGGDLQSLCQHFQSDSNRIFPGEDANIFDHTQLVESEACPQFHFVVTDLAPQFIHRVGHMPEDFGVLVFAHACSP